MSNLTGKVIFITGSTRGIGREIALRCAKDGARIVITGKTDKPHPKLPGTIHTVAEEVKQVGGEALALVLDVRDEKQIQYAIEKTVETFGAIDALVNNASAINLTTTVETPMRRFDLMFNVNVRATSACSQAALPWLLKAENPHILTISPPLNMQAKWFKDHVAYTMSKYGMSMCTLGMAEEFKSKGMSINSLWPQTTIATMAIKVHFPEELWKASRKPTIMADAAYEILTTNAQSTTGNFFIDETVLSNVGVSNFDQYALNPGQALQKDFFLE